MNAAIAVPALVRPDFFDGQRLEAEDLAAIYGYHRELRWLHNRTLHGWGVVVGLEVTAAKGDRLVTVSAGYALDCPGHDLILSTSVSLQVPPVAGPATYYLTVSYLEDGELPEETRTGACATTGAVRRSETARLRWQSPTDVLDPATRFRAGLDVLLASASVENCQLAAVPSLALRREARPGSQPYLVAGRMTAAQAAWRTFSAAGEIQGVEATIDTTLAGFSATPVYSAELVGSRSLPAAGGGSTIVDGFLSIDAPTAAGFVLRVIMPRGLSVPPSVMNPSSLFTPQLPDTVREQLGWGVAWLGVEG